MVCVIVRVIYILVGLDYLGMSYVEASGCTLVPPTHPLAILRLTKSKMAVKKKGGWHKVRRTYALYNRVRESGVEEEVA